MSVGVFAFGAVGATVAVKVTGWPNTDGLTDDVTVVVVAAGATVKFAVFMLKKRTSPEPAWTTMMRAVDVVTFGIVTAWAPSLRVFEDQRGREHQRRRRSTDMMLTLAALIGAPVVARERTR